MIDDVTINSLLDTVLEDVGCTESRASKMDVDDLLKYAFGSRIMNYADFCFRLLAAFHDVGIHFS